MASTKILSEREMYEQVRAVTAVLLAEALERTRMETGGITLEFTARIIKENLKPEEVTILIEHLSV